MGSAYRRGLKQHPGSLLLLALFALLACTAGGCGGSSPPLDTGWPGIPGSINKVNYPAAVTAVTLLNEYRSLANAGPARLDYELCIGAQNHAKYLATNRISLLQVGLGAHYEEVSLPGFTAAGARAGVSSVIYQGVTASQAVENWMQTLYHRLGLLDPNMYTIGFGSYGEYQVMDIRQGKITGPNALPASVVFPAVGMQDVPTRYIQEIPHPIPGDLSLGIPITLEFFGPVAQKISDVETSLIDLETGEVLSIYTQTPDRPFLPERICKQSITIIPADPLASRRTYQAAISALVDDQPLSVRWNFHTQ